MIESNIEEIDVDELRQRIENEVAQRKSRVEQNLSKPFMANIQPRVNLIKHKYIEALLNNATNRASVRTKLPDKFSRIPFNIGKIIEKFLLKAFNTLFKDQREVNFNLIQSLRESVALNQQLAEEVNTLKAEITTRLVSIETSVKTLDNQIQTLDNFSQNLDKRFQYMDERYIRNDSYLKSELAQQKRLLTICLEEAQKCFPSQFNYAQLQKITNESKHSLDALYVAFEDKFRGSREEIYDRFKIYLPLIEEAKIGQSDTPILDIGCGRGEWLELLRESGYSAMGIDTNRVMLEKCRSRELEVIEEDAIKYMQYLPDKSLGAVTGFHIIEHLAFEDILKLFTETLRVLKPEGLVIFETPNPENVLVGTHNFYIDPTHRNPLPSITIRFIAEFIGFCKVDILKLHPYPETLKLSGSEEAERFNDYFYGAQDYAVVGYKL